MKLSSNFAWVKTDHLGPMGPITFGFGTGDVLCNDPIQFYIIEESL